MYAAHPSYSNTNDMMDIPLTTAKESKILNDIYFPFLPILSFYSN